MNDFIKNFNIEPNPTALGKIGEYLFESKLSTLDGLAYLNFNNLDTDNFEEIGRFLSKQRLVMNYRKRGKFGKRVQIPFKFQDAPKSAKLISEILTASPVIDFLVIPPSDRDKVTLPQEEDCIFLDVKTLNKSDHPTYSEKQKWVYYNYKDLNLYSLVIDVTLKHEIKFESPEIAYEPYIAPCGKELPIRITDYQQVGICRDYCSEYPCSLLRNDPRILGS